MTNNQLEELEEELSNSEGNFQLQYDSIKFDDNGEIKSFSILCVASHKSKYVEEELKNRNATADKFFPKEYSFNHIREFDTIEDLGDGDSFYEFKLNRI